MNRLYFAIMWMSAMAQHFKIQSGDRWVGENFRIVKEESEAGKFSSIQIKKTYSPPNDESDTKENDSGYHEDNEGDYVAIMNGRNELLTIKNDENNNKQAVPLRFVPNNSRRKRIRNAGVFTMDQFDFNRSGFKMAIVAEAVKIETQNSGECLVVVSNGLEIGRCANDHANFKQVFYDDGSTVNGKKGTRPLKVIPVHGEDNYNYQKEGFIEEVMLDMRNSRIIYIDKYGNRGNAKFGILKDLSVSNETEIPQAKGHNLRKGKHAQPGNRGNKKSGTPTLPINKTQNKLVEPPSKDTMIPVD